MNLQSCEQCGIVVDFESIPNFEKDDNGEPTISSISKRVGKNSDYYSPYFFCPNCKNRNYIKQD